jgi:NAD(P)-dependent dehydrogenase (short-subunit alcohol dehydrogenase family)
MNAALVTGGAKRLGKAISLRLASLGFDIALHYNNSEKEAVVAKSEIEIYGVRCHIFKCDFSLQKGTDGFMNAVFCEFPHLNVLVNSASLFIRSPITDTGYDLFDLTMNVNFKSPFFLTKEFARRCVKGDIINMLDTKIDGNGSNYAAYSLSKKALHGLTLMSAKELAPGIKVNGIAPGLILPPEGKDDGYLGSLAKDIPLGKRGTPDNIADSVEFILKNEYLTGQVIYCDGGQHL